MPRVGLAVPEYRRSARRSDASSGDEGQLFVSYWHYTDLSVCVSVPLGELLGLSACWTEDRISAGEMGGYVRQDRSEVGI